MEKKQLKEIIDTASGKVKAELVIKNCKIIDVYGHQIIEGDIALRGGFIAGVGKYSGVREINGGGCYASPGWIDGHIHIESSYVTPEEMGRLLVPCGTTMIIADPHEIVNVCGLNGLRYMQEAAKKTALDIKFMVPSCVPATPFESSGAVLDASSMIDPLTNEDILGLGEFMDSPGIIGANPEVVDKVMAAHHAGKLIDGHSPGVTGRGLNAYIGAGIHTDHECSTVKEMHDRISRGMYVLLRQGSACLDLENLASGITDRMSRRCLLCSDDLQPKTIFERGHLDNDLRLCVNAGIDPITAIQMASLNAAECYRLYDRGAIAPGLRGDIVLFESLETFKVNTVFINGEEVVSQGEYLPEVQRHSIEAVRGTFRVRDFSREKLKLKLKSNRVNAITIIPGSVLTRKKEVCVTVNSQNEFVHDQSIPISKVAVIERHNDTGNVALGLLNGYGISSGAIAISIAHDSHNIIVTGVNDGDMELAVETLIEQEGGVVLAKNGRIIKAMPFPIGGIMSDQSGEWVTEHLREIHEIAHRELGISREIEPIMTLCFMSLPVIPELKLTDKGLFDVIAFDFIDIEAE